MPQWLTPIALVCRPVVAISISLVTEFVDWRKLGLCLYPLRRLFFAVFN